MGGHGIHVKLTHKKCNFLVFSAWRRASNAPRPGQLVVGLRQVWVIKGMWGC